VNGKQQTYKKHDLRKSPPNSITTQIIIICPPNCTNLTKFAVTCSSEMYQ